VLGVPLLTLLLGGWVWPELSRPRLLLLGISTVVTMGVVYLGAVFWFYGLGGPTGAWLWAGPLVGLAARSRLRAACCRRRRRPGDGHGRAVHVMSVREKRRAKIKPLRGLSLYCSSHMEIVEGILAWFGALLIVTPVLVGAGVAMREPVSEWRQGRRRNALGTAVAVVTGLLLLLAFSQVVP
jgi:hypothetical protein